MSQFSPESGNEAIRKLYYNNWWSHDLFIKKPV